MEWTRGSYRISDNNEELDLYYIVPALQETYWAASRSPEVIEKSIANSLCFGLYSERRQIGFARVVTDGTTFAWICDVVVHPEFRGAGIGPADAATHTRRARSVRAVWFPGRRGDGVSPGNPVIQAKIVSCAGESVSFVLISASTMRHNDKY